MIRNDLLLNLNSDIMNFFSQEPFVNIPEDAIREALTVVLGIVYNLFACCL